MTDREMFIEALVALAEAPEVYAKNTRTGSYANPTAVLLYRHAGKDIARILLGGESDPYVALWNNPTHGKGMGGISYNAFQKAVWTTINRLRSYQP